MKQHFRKMVVDTQEGKGGWMVGWKVYKSKYGGMSKVEKKVS